MQLLLVYLQKLLNIGNSPCATWGILEGDGLKKTAIILMLVTIISKLLGFFREITMSYYYGASDVSDAYFVSLTIPVVVFSFIGLGISTGYIPMYSKIKEASGELEGQKFTNNLISFFIIISTVLVIVLEVFAEPVVKIFASGFEGKTLELAIKFTRITVLGIYFSGIISIYNGFLQLKNKYLIPALIGFIYNFAIISSIYISYLTNIIILAFGSVVAFIAQFFFLLLFVKKEGYNPNFYINFKDSNIIALGKISLPLIFGTAISQINVLIDKTIASNVAIGGISALNYADRLNSFILSTVVMSISISVYPMMSRSVAENNIGKLKLVISESITGISLLIVPATIGAVLYSSSLVKLLFGRGAFGIDAINTTTSALIFYSVGMMGIGLREILSKAFYSIQETRIPAFNAAIGMVLNIILNIILSRYLGIGGLALATSISATVTTFLLFVTLRKKIGPFGMKQISISFLKILFASLVMGFFSKTSFNYLTASLSQNLSLLLAIGVGAVTYFVIIYFMKIEDVDVIVGVIKKKFGRGAA